MKSAFVQDYRQQGFAVVRGVFTGSEVVELADAFDRVQERGLAYPASYRDGNVLFRQARDVRLGRLLRLVQWPSYFEATLDRFRKDPRMLAILAPLIGEDVKQIINQMHWKTPGAASTEFGFHQDIRFRRPREAYRNTLWSYVQTGIAIDRHGQTNGGMTFLPGSHRLGELELARDGVVMDIPARDGDLARIGLDPAGLVSLNLEPGDVALWNLYTVHGSHTNRSVMDRRFYVNGYVRADDCDRGAWTFRDGAPVDLGAPVLIHYDDLYRRPGPHYVDAA
jgi:ectoine hydroxylase-related dioxygenase (phytanoyl-CoA dioxygenase family)